MLRSSVARIVSSWIGISYVRPVRLSVTVSESVAVATSPPLEVFVSVVTLLQSRWIPGGRAARSERGRPQRDSITPPDVGVSLCPAVERYRLAGAARSGEHTA